MMAHLTVFRGKVVVLTGPFRDIFDVARRASLEVGGAWVNDPVSADAALRDLTVLARERKPILFIVGPGFRARYQVEGAYLLEALERLAREHDAAAVVLHPLWQDFAGCAHLAEVLDLGECDAPVVRLRVGRLPARPTPFAGAGAC